MTETFTFFWAGPFSQWYPCEFTVDGVKYNCAEQFMMAQKAELFGDTKTRNAIMKTSSPKEQKKLGRQVENFDVEKWESVARDIVYRGNVAKFGQDKELRELLIATKGTTMVEASPYDKVWGIGLAEDDHRALRRDNWQGRNWLGEVLTRVREDFLANA